MRQSRHIQWRTATSSTFPARGVWTSNLIQHGAEDGSQSHSWCTKAVFVKAFASHTGSSRICSSDDNACCMGCSCMGHRCVHTMHAMPASTCLSSSHHRLQYAGACVLNITVPNACCHHSRLLQMCCLAALTKLQAHPPTMCARSLLCALHPSKSKRAACMPPQPPYTGNGSPTTLDPTLLLLGEWDWQPYQSQPPYSSRCVLNCLMHTERVQPQPNSPEQGPGSLRQLPVLGSKQLQKWSGAPPC